MSEHTQGPWGIWALFNVGVLRPDGRMDKTVASCGGSGSIQLEEAVSNAKLIAAAPDMLEALKAIRDATLDGKICDDVAWSPSEGETLCDYCERAIAKVEGAAPDPNLS